MPGCGVIRTHLVVPSGSIAFAAATTTVRSLPSLSDSPRSQPYRILTVDDAKAVRRLVEAALRDFNCDVNEADNGFKALFAMERALPDLGLDSLMAVELAQSLESEVGRNVPVMQMIQARSASAVADWLLAGLDAPVSA